MEVSNHILSTYEGHLKSSIAQCRSTWLNPFDTLPMFSSTYHDIACVVFGLLFSVALWWCSVASKKVSHHFICSQSYGNHNLEFSSSCFCSLTIWNMATLTQEPTICRSNPKSSHCTKRRDAECWALHVLFHRDNAPAHIISSSGSSKKFGIRILSHHHIRQI